MALESLGPERPHRRRRPDHRRLSLIAVLVSIIALGVNSMSSAAPPSPPGEPITKDKALEIAKKAVAEFKPGTEFVIHEDKTLEKEFGWVFFYSPKAFLESKDPRTLVPGAGPLVVERLGGGTQYLTTSVPPERAVKEFERRWREEQQKPKS